MQSARTRDALNLAFDLQQRQDAQRWREQTLEQLGQFAREFVTRDVPIMLVTAAFSYGTVSAVHGAWRIMTGIRLSARLLWATEFAVSIPINQAVDRAVGRQVDDSFMGTMRTAGMMLGTQVGARILARVGGLAVSALRSRLGNAVGQLPLGARVGNAILQQELIGGARIGQTGLTGLRDARNLTAARLQLRDSTCGLYASLSAIEDVASRRPVIDFQGVRTSIRLNDSRGLNSQQVVNFISRNTREEQVFARLERSLSEQQLLQLLGRERVIAHVDGNHWVRVLGSFQENGATWVRVYDPARGNYEQMLSSFMTRMGSSNQVVAVRIVGG